MANTSIEALTKQFISTDLTGEDIQNFIGKPPIVYAFLRKYTFDRLLPENSPYQIILLETNQANNGHWVALWADDVNIYYWDSLGMGMPDADAYKPYLLYELKTNNFGTLINILKTDPKQRPIIANYTDYQHFDTSTGRQVSTCGRWSGLRIKLRDLTNDEFGALFYGNSGVLRNRDFTITILTLVALKDIRKYYNVL